MNNNILKTTVAGRNDTRIFEIVDHVPSGYTIWNIGKHMTDGYLPVVRVGGYNGCQVDTTTMKAIKVDGAQTILAACGYGPSTVRDMENYIEKHSGKRSRAHEIERMRKALPIMKQIKGL